jgi:pantothenate kinase
MKKNHIYGKSYNSHEDETFEIAASFEKVY